MIKANKFRIILDFIKSLYPVNIRFFTDVSDGKSMKKIKDEFVIKTHLDKHNSYSNRNEIMTTSDTYLTAPSKIYYDLIEEHKQFRIPFSDDDFYKELFLLTSKIMNNSELESWGIIEKYAILNMEKIDVEFLIDIIAEMSQVKLSNFEFWYRAEKRILNNLQTISNNRLASIIYHFAVSDSGSNHIFNILAEEILNRGIRNFKEAEFRLIYDGFKYNRIKDKMLWAFLNRAKLELYPNME